MLRFIKGSRALELEKAVPQLTNIFWIGFWAFRRSLAYPIFQMLLSEFSPKD